MDEASRWNMGKMRENWWDGQKEASVKGHPVRIALRMRVSCRYDSAVTAGRCGCSSVEETKEESTKCMHS